MIIGEGAEGRPELMDLATELAARSAGLKRSLHDGVDRALADLVRAMNCYYSNLIEGHNTHPVDIERALAKDYSDDPDKRDLQLEAEAHITVQRWIDEGGLEGRATDPDGLCEIHRRFCELLPDRLLRVEDPQTGHMVRVEPGALRRLDVQIGRHVPVSPGALPRFLQRFDAVYGALGRSEQILASAACHHRLLWIHPFLDGNGRVARLMSHAILKHVLDTGGVWSIARGLARQQTAYRRHLSDCDRERRNDLDGRGHLSQEALVAFTRFFLETCLDQVHFMEELVQPERLRTRIALWAEEQTRLKIIPRKAAKVLEAVLYRGQLRRGELPEILNVTGRHARRIVASLTEQGVLRSDTPKGPLRLAFPAKLAGRWMPGLFPET